jgi:drug/metabolite transporter (DMT)-like permease
MVSCGQLLFKLTASMWEKEGTAVSPMLFVVAFSSLAIYASATLLWIFLLRQAPLSRLYPYMALSFVFVALASKLFYGEELSMGMVAGLSMIVAGVVCISLSS